jgi:hypothetical protein
MVNFEKTIVDSLYDSIYNYKLDYMDLFDIPAIKKTFGGYIKDINYNYIINPINQRKVKLNSKIGNKILNNYLNQLNR